MTTDTATEPAGEPVATIYPSLSIACHEYDWPGSVLHIPAQELPDNGGTLREQRIVARHLPDDLRATFEGALAYLLTLAPGEWGASLIYIERREASLRLRIARDAGKIALEPLELDLEGDGYLAFFDTLTSPEFLLDPETKTL